MAPEKPKVAAIEVKPRVERDILRTPQRKGFTRRLALNDPIRIEEMEDLGYRVVKKESGEVLTRREFVVMELPEELYNARQAEKVHQIRQSQKALTLSARKGPEQVAGQDMFRGKAQVIGGVEIEGGNS